MHKYLLFIILFVNIAYGSIGVVTSVRGDGATIQRDDDTLKAVIGKSINQNDIIFTDEKSKVSITMSDNTFITIGKSSALNIEEYIYDLNNPGNSKTNFNFFKGAFKTITGQIGKINPSKFKLKTKSASIGIRGTTIEGTNGTNGTKGAIMVTDGSIFLTVGDKTVIVDKGQISYIDKDIPSAPRKFTPQERKNLKAQLAVKSKTKDVKLTTNSKGKKSGEAKNGVVTVNKDGSITYTPQEGYSGTDTVTITTKAEDGSVITEVITITTPASADGETIISLEQVSMVDQDGVSQVLFNSEGTSSTDPDNTNQNIIDNTNNQQGLIDDTQDGENDGEKYNNTPNDNTPNTTPDRTGLTTVSDVQYISDRHTITQDGDDSIGYTYIELTETSKVSFITHDPDKDQDPEIIIFTDDGDLTEDDFIEEDDDSWTEAGSFDNSIVTRELPAGKYIVVISDFPLSTSDVIAGENSGSSTGDIEVHISANSSAIVNGVSLTTYDIDLSSYGYGWDSSDTENSITYDSNGALTALANSYQGTAFRNSVDDSLFLTTYDSIAEDETYTSTIDDESAWGYWLKASDSTSNIQSTYNTWVSGIVTDVAVIEGYMENNTEVSFRGHMLGAVKDLSTLSLDPIEFDSTNNITIDIDFGSGQLQNTSQFEFNTLSGQNWSGSFGVGSVTTSGFSTSLSSGTGGDNSITSSSIEGKFYGTDEVKSIGGEFEFGTGAHEAFGVFKADKQ